MIVSTKWNDVIKLLISINKMLSYQNLLISVKNVTILKFIGSYKQHAIFTQIIAKDISVNGA